MSGTLSLSELPRALRELTGKRATYQKLYRLTIDGDIPAIKTVRGRWLVKESDLPGIARTLGFTEV